MTTKEQIKRITGLLNDLNLNDISREDFEKEIMDNSINDIMDELWRLYCFAKDIAYILCL